MSTRLAGSLWIMAGVVCAGLLSFVLVGEHVNDLGFLLANLALPARVLGGALLAFVNGSLLLVRPGPNVVRWSSLAGIAWLFAFGPLVVTAVAAALGGYEVGPVISSSLITGLGIAGAVVGHLSPTTRRSLR
ncbi:MAG TPA: hypothetical protein VF802_03070 [Candidatus Limnocylindrales bacterium]